MNTFELSREQQLRIRMVAETKHTFMLATGRWPTVIHVSAEFLKCFGLTAWVGGLEIWGCLIQPVEGQSGHDHRLFCYADTRQLVD